MLEGRSKAQQTWIPAQCCQMVVT